MRVSTSSFLRNNRCLFVVSMCRQSTKYDRSKSTHIAPAVFCTFPKTPDGFNRSDFVNFGIKHIKGVQGGIVARECHDDGSYHYHAAYFGNITRKNCFPKFQKAVQGYKSSDGLATLAGTGCKAQFTHTKTNARWPFNGAPKPDMIDYLTVASPHKPEPDMQPRCFIVDGEAHKSIDVQQLRDAYDEFNPKAEGFAASAETIIAMKQAGATESDAIMAVAEHISKDNSYHYKMLMDLFKATPVFKPEKAFPLFEPYPWQQVVIDWVMQPIDETNNNKRGMWIKTDAGSGKSTLIKMIMHAAGGRDKVFIPGTKGGVYCTESMCNYKEEKIICIDDVRAHAETNETQHHKGTLVAFLKAITTADIMSYVIYGEKHEFEPTCRVIVTSNFEPPLPRAEKEQSAFSRRFSIVDTTDANVLAGIVGLPREIAAGDGEIIAVRAGTAAAAAAAETPVIQTANEHLAAIHAAQQRTPPQAGQRRRRSPPSSGNPAPHNRVRWGETEDAFVFTNEVDDIALEMQALKPPTPRTGVRTLFEEECTAPDDEHLDTEFPYDVEF